jgi:uncharacterized protein (TIGR03083 family)
MTMTAAPAATAIPRTGRRTAAGVAAAETAMFLAVLDRLPAGAWDAPTDCGRWRVREMVAHITGAAEESARVRTFARHVRQGKRRYPDLSQLDGLNEVQVDDRRHLQPEQLRAEVERWLAKATPARARPLPIRWIPLPLGEELGVAPLAYAYDVIYIRDLWMHRVDITRASGVPFERASHEAEIIQQVVRDLGRAWAGPSVDVELVGPAAGCWRLGSGTPTGTVRVTDDVEWMRTLSGRPGEPPLEATTGDPPVRLLAEARVAF